MSQMIYEVFALLEDHSDFDLDATVLKLEKALPGFTVYRRGKQITAKKRNWAIKLMLEEQPHVIEESREIAEILRGNPQAARIANCKRRVVVWSTDPDPNMDFFNDYLLVVHAVQEFAGVNAYEMQTDTLF